MTQEEKLEKAKELYPTANAEQRYVLECLFPELAESEDERTRKEILNVFKQLDEGTTICGRNYDYAKWIAWIEKQGEQNLANSAKTCKKSQRMVSAEAKEALYDKPAWSEEDEEMLDGIILRCEKYGHQEQINWLKSLKPQSWTKEDKERYISCLQRLSTGNPEQPETINSKWFKEHVYSQPRWKPSKEQINAFEQVYEWYNNNFASSETLTSLYNDLKKLREEQL